MTLNNLEMTKVRLAFEKGEDILIDVNCDIYNMYEEDEIEEIIQVVSFRPKRHTTIDRFVRDVQRTLEDIEDAVEDAAYWSGMSW